MKLRFQLYIIIRNYTLLSLYIVHYYALYRTDFFEYIVLLNDGFVEEAETCSITLRDNKHNIGVIGGVLISIILLKWKHCSSCASFESC
jgi:hypothetical protein